MRPAYENALPGNCKGCGKPGADIRRKGWHQTCWDNYREGSNYRGAAERREGQHQRCSKCQRLNGALETIDGKPVRIKITRDHIIALALNGPHDWTGPLCQYCHQEKTNDDNRRVKDWRDRNPRANRADRSDRRTMTNTRPRPAPSKNRSTAPPPLGPVRVAIRVVTALAVAGYGALWFVTGSPTEPIDRAGTVARAIAPYALYGALGLVLTALVGWIARWRHRRRNAAHEEAIYRLANALSKKMKVAPDVIRIKVRGWSHNVPVRGSAYYTEAVDDMPGSPVRDEAEEILEHKLGLTLAFDWQHWADTVYWWPAPEDASPEADRAVDEPVDDEPDPGPDPEEERERLRQGMTAVLGDGVEVDVIARHDDGSPQSIRITYPPSAKVHDDKVVDAVEGKMASLITGRWRVEWDTKHDRVLFTDTPDPLAAPVMLPRPEKGAPVDVLPCGRLESGALWQIKLDDAPHLLVAGATGSGKGSVLWSIVRALIPAVLDGRAELIGIDPKGMELARGRDIFNVYVVNPKDAAEKLRKTVDRMNERKVRLGADRKRTHVATPGDPKVFIFIDEIAALTSYGVTKQLAADIISSLGLLTTQGRAIGFHVIGAVQDPRKEVLKIRGLFTGKIALRLSEAGEVDLVLEKGSRAQGARADKIPAELPGVGFITLDGKPLPERFRAGWVSDDEIEAMEAAVVASRGGRRNAPPAPPPRQQAREAVTDGWELVDVADLELEESARLLVDGEPTEVTIVELVEAADDENVIEVTYRDADGNEAVIAYESDDEAWRRASQ